MTLNSTENLFSFKNLNSIKVNMSTHVCLRRKCQLILILRHWIYSKCKDILHTLNVYEISAKGHEVVHRSAADETSISKILFWKHLA